MTERQLIAYAILVVLLAIGAVLLWRRSRRGRRTPDAHLRIDLLGEGAASGAARAGSPLPRAGEGKEPGAISAGRD